MGIEETKNVRKHLINELRRKKIRVFYKDLIRDCGLSYMPNSNHIGSLLTKISEYECQKQRPLLSAMVISVETNLPGVGFYELLKEVPLSPQEKYDKELNALLEFWSDEKNYLEAFSDDAGL